MADFTPTSETKSALRKLAEPLADVTAFDNIVQGVITNNPFGCTPYNQAGSDHQGVERSKAGYTARIVYQDTLAKPIALITIRSPTIAGFTAVANHIVEDPAIGTGLGGTPVRDFGNERYTSTLKCHDPNGEIYYLNFSRDRVTLTSFSADAIQSKVETWADTVAALA
jgi:hypothetical protein